MIVRLVCNFIKRTFMAIPSCTHVAVELGYLFILQDQVKEASLWYSEAMKLDENSVAALTGLCRLGGGGVEGGQVLGAKQGGLPGSKRDQRGCELGGALYDRAPFHESISIGVRGTGALKRAFRATLMCNRPPRPTL